MSDQDVPTIRAALQSAKDDLLEGRVPGPLTSIRLVEVAGVKRHRLTHDNKDINDEFQQRARELNRTKPEVDGLRVQLEDERRRNMRLVAERDALDKRVKAYATALHAVIEERDRLAAALKGQENIPDISDHRR